MKIKHPLLFLFTLVFCSTAFAAPSAYEAVTSATDDLLQKLKDVQPLYESNPEEFYREVDSSLAPFIDFQGFSRGVMAKYYRRATPEQREKFSLQFRDSLIRTYSKALMEFDNQKVVVSKDTSAGGNPTKPSVHLAIHGSNGAVYPVEYSMVMVDGVWKLRNVVIEGINIGLQFRSQFSANMQRHRNNVDAVIENWRVDE